MANTVTRYINEHRLEIEGQIDLSAGAAVTASRVSGATVAKSATGTYTVTFPASMGLNIVELLDARSNFSGTVPATATGTRVSTVALNAAGDLVITLKTMASPNTGADTDTTAATTLNFRVVIRVNKMGNPL